MADLAELNVMRIATLQVITLAVGTSLADTVATLSDERLKKVPVVDGDLIVGIVSRSAINRLAIAGYLRTRGPGSLVEA